MELICETCGKRFERRESEVKRNRKRGRKTYCSLSCVGHANHKHLKARPENLIAGNRRDDLSPFGYVMKCIKNKHPGRGGGGGRKSCQITLEDIKEQWDKQSGICPYTGWPLKLREHSRHNLEYTPDRASLDRIDSSKPYTKDNIQFVSMIAQFAKNRWSGEELLNFCKAVVEHSC
jgi:hypothetical protein